MRLRALHSPGLAGLMVTAGLVMSAGAANAKTTGAEFIYAGTWNNIEASDGLGFAKGVYGWKVDPASGKAEALGVVAPTIASADSLAASPDGRTLYVTGYNGCICTRSWPFPGAQPATIAAYRIDPNSGALTYLNQASGLGDMPAEIRADKTGRTLALANYYGGNVVTYRLNADGSIAAAVSNVQHSGASVHASAGPHPHGLAFSTDNRVLYVADQGLDRLYLYRFDPKTSAITPATTPYIQFKSGEGPRQVSVSHDGKWVFVITEQGGDVHRFARKADGTLEKREVVSMLSPQWTIPLGAAQSRVSPDGRFLYANHRPHEGIAAFSIDRRSGALKSIGHFASSERVAVGDVRKPLDFGAKTLWNKVETGARAFSWSSAGGLVASASLGEDSLVLLRRDALTGALAAMPTVLPVPQPSFVLFVRPK